MSRVYGLCACFKCLIAIKIGAHHAIVRFVSNVTLIVSHTNYLYIYSPYIWKVIRHLAYRNIYLTTFYGFDIITVFRFAQKVTVYLIGKKNFKNVFYIFLSFYSLKNSENKKLKEKL